jgi:hypothetical protein
MANYMMATTLTSEENNAADSRSHVLQAGQGPPDGSEVHRDEQAQ